MVLHRSEKCEDKGKFGYFEKRRKISKLDVTRLFINIAQRLPDKLYRGVLKMSIHAFLYTFLFFAVLTGK